ncbi:MAG: hypothetical protein WC666_04210 [Candidatus Paceibacterota bacterium]|jgi:hypothetical protein
MKKLANQLFDVTDMVTSGKIEYLVGVTKGKDELVKNAHIPSLEEVEDMPDSQFALVLYHPHMGKMKKLAMSDKYLTELNMNIFEDRVDSLPEQVVKIAAYYLCKAAKHYKLAVPEKIKKYAEEKALSNYVNLSEVKATPAPQVKTAEKVSYALGNKYPLSNAGLVKKAMSYFADHGKRFNPENAIEFAANVKVAADKMNVSYVGTAIEKYASLTAESFNKQYEIAIRARKSFVLEEDRQAYDELIAKSAELGVIKTAEILEKLDRASGAYRQWNVGLVDPYLSVLGVKEEKLTKHAGRTIKAADFKKLSSGIVDDATLADLQGPDGLDVFDSLPTPVKNKLVKELQHD